MKAKNKKLIIAVLITAAAAVLAAVGFFVLPDTLVMQVTISGESGTTMPKVLGIALPFALTAIFSVLYYKSGSTKNLFVSLVGLLAFILVFVFNM